MHYIPEKVFQFRQSLTQDLKVFHLFHITRKSCPGNNSLIINATWKNTSTIDGNERQKSSELNDSTVLSDLGTTRCIFHVEERSDVSSIL